MTKSAAERIRANLSGAKASPPLKLAKPAEAEQIAAGKIPVPLALAEEVEAEAQQAEAQDVGSKTREAVRALMEQVRQDQFGDFLFVAQGSARREVLSLESVAGTDYIVNTIRIASGKFPPKSQIENLKSLFRIEGRQNTARITTHVRIARNDGAQVIDLGDAEGRCVRIENGGWQIEANEQIAFLRGRGYGALPAPIRPRSPQVAFRLLFDWLLSLGIPRSRAALVLVTLVAWLRTGGTYPVLQLYGTPGSGKSTAARLILLLIDPTESAALPNVGADVEHIAAAAQHRHIISFDNVSRLSGAQQDVLCTCATGGEIVVRRLYTNGDTAILPIHRPCLITSVQPVITRGDLMSRAIPVEFQQRAERKSDTRILDEFLEVRPGLLGALCELAAAGGGE